MLKNILDFETFTLYENSDDGGKSDGSGPGIKKGNDIDDIMKDGDDSKSNNDGPGIRKGNDKKKLVNVSKKLTKNIISGDLEQPEPVKFHRDKSTGEQTIDKSKIPLDAQIRAYAKKLYKVTVDSARYQTIMNDKMTKLQQFGADEQMMAPFQQMMQDQMMALQMDAMNIEMAMMGLAGQNMQMSQLAQKLSGDVKMVAGKANKEWFDKRAKKLEIDTMKQLQQKQQEAQAKQKEKGK